MVNNCVVLCVCVDSFVSFAMYFLSISIWVEYFDRFVCFTIANFINKELCDRGIDRGSDSIDIGGKRMAIVNC